MGSVSLVMIPCNRRYPGGVDAATLSELRDACAGALRYAQERNAYTDEGQGQAALLVSWQAAVEVTFTRRWVLGPEACHTAWTLWALPRCACGAADPVQICCKT